MISPTYHPLRVEASEQIGEILADALGIDCDPDVLQLVAVDDGRVVSLDNPKHTVSTDFRVYTLVDTYNMLRYGLDSAKKGGN